MKRSINAVVQPLESRRLMDAADLNTAFGDGGGALVDLGPESVAGATAVQPDGKILVAGSQGSNAFLARFNADGSFDDSFATGGVAKLNLGANEFFNEIAVVKNGRILVSGGVSGGVSRF